jgi:hypothetical protein
VPEYGYYAFLKPSVHGFPTAADPADRTCRYLVQPPTVPSLARLRGYQRPPRGGRSRCRRACERNPPPGPPPLRRRRAPLSLQDNLVLRQRPSQFLTEYVHFMRQTFDDYNETREMIDGSLATRPHHLGLLMLSGISSNGPFG